MLAEGLEALQFVARQRLVAHLERDAREVQAQGVVPRAGESVPSATAFSTALIAATSRLRSLQMSGMSHPARIACTVASSIP